MNRAASALLLVAACTASPSRSATAPAPPEDVTWLLAVAVEGDAIKGSPLVARERLDDVGAVLPEGWASSEEVWILGFTQAEIDAIPWTPSDAPARAAEADDFLLPIPAWRVRGAIEGGEALLEPSPDAPPMMTIEGLPACPAVYGEASFADVRCRSQACVAAIEQRGCAISIDRTGCEMRVEATLDGRGEPVFAPSSGCERQADRDGPRSVVECPDVAETRCSIHLYDALDPIEHPVETAKVYEVEAMYINAVPFEDLGYLGGLAVLEDRVVVLGYGGRINQIPCADHPSELVFLTRGLEPIRTSSTVACLRDIVAAPDGQHFFGLVADKPTTRFLELDREGVVLREVERPSPEPNRAPEYRRIVLHGEGRYASFLEFHGGSRVERLITVDLVTFALTDAVIGDEDSVRPYDFAGLEGARVLIADRENNRLVPYDTIRDAEDVETPMCDRAVHPEAVFVDGVVAYALGTGDDTALSVLDLPSRGERCVVAKPFVAQLDAREIVGFFGGDLLITARTLDLRDETRPGVAVLTSYLPDREAFRPGHLELGFGMPRHAQLAGDALYLTLPWSAEVVRVLLAD